MRTFIVAAVVIAATAWVMPTRAADLGGYSSYECVPSDPSHFGEYAPWSHGSERPPRRGRWYYTNPRPPAVNFLIPMREGLCLRPTPWTEAWYDYCARRWPSFNPRTGTIQTPDGVRMCI